METHGEPLVVIAGAGAMFLLARTLLSFSLIYAAIAAGLCFMLTPQGFHFNVVSAVNPSMDSAAEYVEKVKEETIRRLGAFASSFEKLAGTFSGLSAPVKTSLNKKDASQLIEDLAARACHSCKRKNDCWEESLSMLQLDQHQPKLLRVLGRPMK